MDVKYNQAFQDEMFKFINHGMKKHKITGMSIALVDEDEIAWAAGFGYSDKKNKCLANTNTIFKAGSITKIFTATAIMQLVEQGKLDLDVPIQTYIPELHPKYHIPTNKPITLRSIMTHTSGLASDVLSGMFTRNPKPFTEAVKYLNNTYAAMEPGTTATYSNIATDLLGIVIQRISGQSYADYIQDHILAPAGMESSTVDDNRVDYSRLSLPYHNNKYREEHRLRDLPAGNLYTTALDMAKFISIVLKQGYPLISKTSFREMTQAQSTHTLYNSGAVIGLNWFMNKAQLDYLGPVLWHTGGTINFMSELKVLPEQGLGVIVLSNSANGLPLVDKITNSILQKAAKIKHNLNPPAVPYETKFIAPPIDIIKNTTGLYAGLLGPIKISAAGNNLNTTLSGKKLRLQYQKDGWFSLQYRLFGLIPIPIKSLSGLLVQAGKMHDKKILQIKHKGILALIGIEYKPSPVSEPWQDLLGDYQVEYPPGDFHFIEKIKLYQKDGYLVLGTQVNTFGKLNLILDPISDEMAVIAGLGRYLQETITVDRSSGTHALKYSGYRLCKL